MFLKLLIENIVETRLGNLDLRLKEKAQYWRETEECLVKDGW